MIIYKESTLGTSRTFKDLNRGLQIEKKAVDLIKTAQHLKNTDIETAYISVRQITDTLTNAAMKAFDNEDIILVYNNIPKQSVTQALPFITFKMKSGVKTYVFVDKYITVSRDGVLNMQAPILRDLLTAAVVANGIKKNYNNLSSNQYLQKLLMNIYDKFFTRIINREFAIAADKQIFDSIQYYVNRFFLERIFGAADSEENIDKLSKSHIKYLDDLTITELTNTYNREDPVDIGDLLELLKTLSPRMRSLNLGTFLTDWTNYYYIPSMLAVDNIEYLIFMCITLLAGNSIINISASDIVKEAKNIKSFRGELLKLI